MVSERQTTLIQGAAFCLVENLRISTDEAVTYLAGALRSELNRQKTSFESLEDSNHSERTLFIGNVVNQLEDDLRARKRWPGKAIENSIHSFMKIMLQQWSMAS